MVIELLQYIHLARLHIIKIFDAVKSIREIRDVIYEQTQNMSEEELIEHYIRKVELIKAQQKKYPPYQRQ